MLKVLSQHGLQLLLSLLLAGNQAAQVVRKQFPLRPAAAKTIHRSQNRKLLSI